jgi:hypothetical protein
MKSFKKQKILKRKIANKETKIVRRIFDTQVVNSIQKAYIDKVSPDKYGAFKLFSLDASDLEVLDNIESTVAEGNNEEIRDITKEIAKLENFKMELSEAKNNEKLFKLKKRLEIMTNNMEQELGKIEKDGWKEKSDNSIDGLEV